MCKQGQKFATKHDTPSSCHYIYPKTYIYECFYFSCSCHGPPEECILLCQALLQALHWLVKSSTLTLERMRETRDRQVLARNLDIIAEVLRVLCQTRTNQILLHIAKLEDSGKS